MATNRWLGKAQKTAQVNTITPANVGIGNTFTVTINAKSYTFTATATTVANVTAGLQALVAASNEGEYTEAEWSDDTTSLGMDVSSALAGTPITQTSSASGGTATLTTAVATANVSPSDVNNATNWSDGVPDAADDCVVDAGDVPLLWNLGALSAVTLTSFTRRRSHTGAIGLPEQNERDYWEYRATELAISATTMTIETGGDDPASLKFNVGSVQTALTIRGESSGAGALGDEIVWWRGTHVSNVVNVINSSLAVGVTNLNAAAIATLRMEDSTVRLGSAVTTLTAVTNLDSTFETNSTVVTYTQRGDAAVSYWKQAAAVTTLNNLEGTVIWQSSGTITTYTPGPDSEIDFSQGSGAVTITNAVTFPFGSKFRDPEGRVTLSGGFALATGVRLEDVELDFGTGRTHTVS